MCKSVWGFYAGVSYCRSNFRWMLLIKVPPSVLFLIGNIQKHCAQPVNIYTENVRDLM